MIPSLLLFVDVLLGCGAQGDRAWSAFDAEPRFAVRTSVALRGATLEDACAVLSSLSTAKLTVHEALRERRLNLFAAGTPLRSLLKGLAEATRLCWRLNEGVYELYLSAEQSDRETALVRASKEFDARLHSRKVEGLLAAIRDAARTGESERPEALGIVLGLDESERRSVAEAAAAAEGVVATDNSHFGSHMLFAKPFGELDPALQQQVAKAVLGPGSQDFKGVPVARGARDMPTLRRSRVGLIGMNGGVHLGVVGEDGGIWASHFSLVRRKGMLGVDSDDDLPPEVSLAIRAQRLVDLGSMPAQLRGKRVRFGEGLERTRLSVLLAEISRQTGVPIGCDDFLRNRRTVYSWLLTDRDEYTIEDALAQIAPAFGRKFEWRHGMLIGRTVSLGLDLRAEPPPGLLARLSSIGQRREKLAEEDWMALGRLSRLQLDTIIAARVEAIRGRVPLSRAQRFHPVLRFWADLTPAERARAEAEGGLPVSEMSREAREKFRQIARTGVPEGLTEGGTTPRRGGLSIERKRSSAGLSLTFRFHPETKPERPAARCNSSCLVSSC